MSQIDGWSMTVTPTTGQMLASGEDLFAVLADEQAARARQGSRGEGVTTQRTEERREEKI